MIKFVCCFWNAEQYLKNCIATLKAQKDRDFEAILIDDLSTDNSASVAADSIDNDSRFELIVNREKKFKLRNLDETISQFDDEDIAIEIDGDDSLSNSRVVGDIRKIYKNKKVWLTNGSFVYSNGDPGFASKCNPETVRNDPFRFSHLRTWKAFLWKAIPKSYLRDEDGSYFRAAPDVAYSLSLLELAGNENYRFLRKPYYIYNAESPFNEHKIGSACGGGQSEQERCADIIRNKPKLHKLIR